MRIILKVRFSTAAAARPNAMKWYRKLADLGDPEGHYGIGYGVKADCKTAFDYIKNLLRQALLRHKTA